MLESLNIELNTPVLVVVGWAGKLPDNTATVDAINILLRVAVAPVCRSEGVIVITGGTNAGIMAAVGNTFAECAPEVHLIGVAPNAMLVTDVSDAHGGRTAPEPHHQLIATPGEAWGDEAPYLIRVAELIGGPRGVTVLAVGGNGGTVTEIEYATRRAWPVILLSGHDGASDRIARETLRDNDSKVGVLENTQKVAVELNDVNAVERLLRWRLTSNGPLKEAWQQFADMDMVASQRKRPTNALLGTLLVLATLTALLIGAVSYLRLQPSSTLYLVLKILATVLPISAGIVLALVRRRSNDGSWIDIRSTAETMISEIYRYRSKVSPYDDSAISAHVTLADRFFIASSSITAPALSAASVNVEPSTWPPLSLWDRVADIDSLLGPLTLQVYDSARAIQQMAYFRKSLGASGRTTTRLTFAIFGLAGAASFFAAFSWRAPSSWSIAAGLAAIVAALVTWREYGQRDARSTSATVALLGVRAARARWLALSFADRENLSYLAKFVEEVESALSVEISDWQRTQMRAYENLVLRS